MNNAPNASQALVPKQKKSCNAKRVDMDVIQIVLQYFTNLLIHCGTLIMDKIFW